jgi:hypothetical protein
MYVQHPHQRIVEAPVRNNSRGHNTLRPHDKEQRFEFVLTRQHI